MNYTKMKHPDEKEIFMKKRIGLSLILVICLMFCLVGCGKEETEETAPDAEQTTDVAEQSEEGDEEELKEEGSGVIMMTVGKSNVYKEEVLFYMHQLREKYEGTLGKEIWNIKIVEDQDFGTYALEEIQKMILEVNIICQEAGKREIILDEDEKMEARALAENYMSTLSEEEKAQAGFSIANVTKVYEQNMLASKMYDITTADVNTNISDEEAREVTIQYLKIITNGEDKTGKQIRMNSQEKAEAKKTAQELLKQAKETEDFKTFAQQNSDAAEVELTFGREDGPEDFVTQAFQLETGGFSPVIEAESGYYILYCVSDFDQEAVTAKKEEIIENNQQEAFMKAYEEWSSDYEVVISKPQWDTLRF